MVDCVALYLIELTVLIIRSFCRYGAGVDCAAPALDNVIVVAALGFHVFAISPKVVGLFIYSKINKLICLLIFISIFASVEDGNKKSIDFLA